MGIAEYSKRHYVQISLIIIFSSFTIHTLREHFFLINKAKELSKNHQNIYLGCLYLEKVFSTKHGIERHEVNINGEKLLLQNMNIHGFPFHYKYFVFQQKIKHNTCYKVRYIQVNYLLANRTYIYDLVE